MGEKKTPPPPAMPPNFSLKNDYCLFHKGDLSGDIYTCPSCKAQYCLDCAKKAKEEKKYCVKCKQLILL